MKKAAIIGSPTLHKNYKTALEKASCEAVIFPDASYVNRHPDAFDGLLLPGGGDVPASLSGFGFFPKAPARSKCCLPPKPPCILPVHCRYSPYSAGSPSLSGHRVSTPSAGFCASCYPKNSTVPPGSVPDFLLGLEQLSALDLFCARKKPVFGICKGMQLINLYFGGTIRNTASRTFHQHPDKDVFHPADNQPGSFLHALFGSHMLINSSHHQCIDTLAKNLQIIQRAEDGEAEAITHLTSPVFGTQWHPERMPKLPRQDAILLFRYFVSLL